MNEYLNFDKQIANYVLIGTLAFIAGGMFPLSKYEKLNNIAAFCVLIFPVLIVLLNIK